jgi:hypothetical protein
LAKHEFEAWFLAAIESLRGRCGVVDYPEPVADPEGVRNAKGALTGRMSGGRKYSAVLDQSVLAALFDLQLARRRSDSFNKCWREVERHFALAAEEPPAASP